MVEVWGWHLILDCKAGKQEHITSKELITSFAKYLVKALDMKAFGEPTVVHFAEHDAEKAGYSLIQLIETSNITGHFVDISGDFYLDIFSCKEYNKT
jgi:S-adenosylmethionine/arginine decarboxylase-like enzyme